MTMQTAGLANTTAYRLVVLHGAGAGFESDFLQRVIDLLKAKGHDVEPYEFEYMRQMRISGTRRPPPAVSKLAEELSLWLSQQDKDCLVIGKSMGGRVASLVAAENHKSERLKALVVFGYPFHPPAKKERLRTAHLPDLRCPMLVIQGTRDPMGSLNEVVGYAMPDANPEIHWLESGDHDFVPLKSSQRTQQDLIEEGVSVALDWLRIKTL